MDKLEAYLDQVCRGIAGPRALRAHVRQELREHLLDAAAEHKHAGLPEDRAIEQALADFGAADDVRSELTATHGQRVMAVVIDKALDWKEKTMRAKWLWTTWATLAAALVVALEVLLITFVNVFIIPKYQRLMQDGMIDVTQLGELGVGWMPGFLAWLRGVGGHATLLLFLALAAVGLFEWRVRTENKAFVRLSALGTVAVGLMAVVIVMAGSLVIPPTAAMPALGQMTRPWAVEQVGVIGQEADRLTKEAGHGNWETLEASAAKASAAVNRLSAGPAITSLAKRDQSPTADDLRTMVRTAGERLRDAQQAIREKDEGRLKAAVKQFDDAIGPVRTAAGGEWKRE